MSACGEPVLWAFVDRIAFVVASGNGDAHLKNWALVYRDPSSECVELADLLFPVAAR